MRKSAAVAATAAFGTHIHVCIHTAATAAFGTHIHVCIHTAATAAFGTHIHACIHTPMPTQRCQHTHTNTVYTRIHIHTHTPHTHTHTPHTRTHTHTHVHTCSHREEQQLACGNDPNCRIAYEWNDQLKYAFIYHFFGLLWTNQFLVGFSSVTIAGTSVCVCACVKVCEYAHSFTTLSICYGPTISWWAFPRSPLQLRVCECVSV